MAEQEENDSGPSRQQTPPARGGFAIEKPQPVCPKCFQPCNPMQNYCPNCDSNEAMNPLATYMPLESIRFIAGIYGKMWRAVFLKKQTSWIRRLVYLIILLLAVPIILAISLPWAITAKIKDPELKNAVKIIALVLMLLVMVYLIFFL